MALIPEDKIAEIRDRTDIVAIVGEYVALKRTGVNHKGLCPFHAEKSPSFNVNAQKQFFHCFGCNKSGDVFTFISEIEGKSFVEVARELARRAGVDLPEPPRSPREEERLRAAESERAKLVRLNEMVATWFRAQLEAPAGAEARAYLEKRGIGPGVGDTFRVGYAPAGWDALTRYLESKKVPHELTERAGLLKQRDNQRVPAGTPPSKATHFDVFVDRLMYALTSPMGEVIGFGGRVIDPEHQPKYKNSPETLLFKKGENLFGLHAAKHAIRKGGRALVVEGNFDVMTLHQSGVDYAVAPQGTAMTLQQVELLKRFARDVVLMLDADPAGRAATLKVVHLFVEAELPARIAQLRAQGGKKVDPDDLARNDLPKLQALIDGAQDALEFFFGQVASTSVPSVPGRVAAIEECTPLLRAIRDPLSRDLYIDLLARLLKVDVGLVQRTLRAAPTTTRREMASLTAPSAPPSFGGAPGPAEPPTAPLTAPSTPPSSGAGPVVRPRKIAMTYAKLLAFLSAHPTLIARIDAQVLETVRDSEVRALLAKAVERRQIDPTALLADCAPEIRDAVARALISDEFAQVAAPGRVLDDILSSVGLPADRETLMRERAEAVAIGDRERAEKLNARILGLTRFSGQG